ncbi:hypothetical protein D3C75_595470 [compost metagenome]
MEALVRETADCQCTVVGAQAAAARGNFVGECIQLIRTKQCAESAGAGILLGNQRTAVRSHNPGNIRSYHGSASQLLKCPQNRFIIEGSALNNDITPQILGVTDFDNLLQRILNDGIGESCRQVGQGGAFLLHLLHLRVHKYSTA